LQVDYNKQQNTSDVNNTVKS